MRKFYSFFSILFCLIICGNSVAADVTMPVDGKYYKIRNVDPTADSKGAGKYMTNQLTTGGNVTAVSLKEEGDILLSIQDDKYFKFQHVATNKYMSYIGYSDAYTMSWQDDATLDGVKFTVTVENDYSRIARSSNSRQILFWDRDVVGVYNDTWNDNRGRWVFEEVDEEVVKETLVNVTLPSLITEAEAALLLEGKYGILEKRNLQSSLELAKAFNAEGLTVADIRSFIANFSETISLYLASKASSIDTNMVYYLELKVGNVYMGRADEKQTTVLSLRGNLDDETAYPVVFVPVGTDVYNIKRFADLEEDEYLTFNSWNSYFKPKDNNVDIEVKAVDDEFYLLKFVKNAYIGPDNEAEGSEIYTNKGANDGDNKRHWRLVPYNYFSLPNLIAAAEALSGEGYTASTWAALQEELTKAKAVNDDIDNATEEELAGAVSGLKSAMDNLVERDLQLLVYMAEDLKAEDYTSTSWTALQTALTSAKSALEPNTPQETVDAAMNELDKAMAALINISALKESIALTTELVEADYSKVSWTAMKAALETANTALETAETQETADLAAETLKTAVEALVNVVDLRTLIESVAEMDENNYTTGSWAALQTALTTANAALETLDSQEASVAAVSDLKTAIDALIDITALKANLADIEASELKEGDYSVASWKALADALATAEAVQETAETQMDVNNALNALTTALNGLINVTDLKTVIESGKDFVESDYTTTSWTAYNTALGTANAAVETAVSESTVANAKSALDAAIKGLVNVKDLRALVTTAKEKKEADYTAESWSAFKSALNAAESALETAADQTVADSAKDALQKAIDNLALKTGIEALQSAGIDMYVSGRTLYVTGLNDQVVISGYDVSGRMIFTEQAVEATFTHELPAGNYVITIKGYVNGSALVISK